MDNPRPEKVGVVDEVRERISSSSAVLLTEYRGLKVGEIAALRRNLKAVGGDYKVYKNTLVRFAVRDLGLEGVEELLVGPTALAFVDGDAAAVAKALRDYGRTNPNLVLKGGLLGDRPITADEARELADLPSRDVLLARVAGGLAAPMVQLAGLLQALPRNFAYGLKALIELQGGAPDDSAPTEGDAPGEAAATAQAGAADESPAGDETAASADEVSTIDEPATAEPATDAEPTTDEEPDETAATVAAADEGDGGDAETPATDTPATETAEEA